MSDGTAINRAIAQLEGRARNLARLRDQLAGSRSAPQPIPATPPTHRPAPPPRRGLARPTKAELPGAILDYLREHPDSMGREIAAALDTDQPAVSVAMKSIVGQLTVRQDGHSKRWRLKEAVEAA